MPECINSICIIHKGNCQKVARRRTSKGLHETLNLMVKTAERKEAAKEDQNIWDYK
jgi:hypothetical protein